MHFNLSLSLSLSLSPLPPSLPPSHSTLMRRVPDPESPRWNHMALYLHSREPNQPGIWMEDYKFLAAYKLKPTVSYSTSTWHVCIHAHWLRYFYTYTFSRLGTTIRQHISAHIKFIRVCQDGPPDKFMRFLFMHSSVLCVVTNGMIKFMRPVFDSHNPHK